MQGTQPGAADAPLAGVRVIDLTSNVAGPFGSAILADLGADVIHVESPSGDDARRLAPSTGWESGYFTIANRGKSGICLDIRSANDHARLLKLLTDADVFVTNLRPGKLQQRGLDAATLAERFPTLIHATLSAYGDAGDERDRPGYDGILQARTGLAAVTGEADGAPVRVGVSILDVGSGTWLALGIIAALYRRTFTGVGCAISTSLFETGVSWVAYHVAAHQLTGEPSTRHGSGHPAFSPYGIYQTGDGRICIGVGGDRLFEQLCMCLGRAELIRDSRFRTNNDRTRNDELLRAELEAAMAEHSAGQLALKLSERGLPVDVVQQPEDLLTDAQAHATGILQSIRGPQGVELRIPGLPLTFDGQRPRFRAAAPPFEAVRDERGDGEMVGT